MSRPVVAGFDGSPASEQAIDLAVHEAVRRDTPLRIVHGFAWPYMHVAGGPFGPGPGDAGMRMQAEKTLAAGCDRATVQLSKVGARRIELTAEIVVGFPSAVLIAESVKAAMVVVGDRGVGGFAGLLAGSVATQLVTHSRGPVIVTRGRLDPAGDVVVGVDGSDANDPAIRFAFEEAHYRGCAVRPVLVWSHPTSRSPGDMLPLVFDPDLLEQQSGKILEQAIAADRESQPTVAVRPRLIRGRTRRTLIEQSRDAGLVVVGRTGHSSVTEWVLGTVSRALLHHADCPLAVVPAVIRH